MPKPKPPYRHVCPQCGTEFLHGSSRRVFCTKPCRLLWHSQKRRLGRPKGTDHHAAKVTERQVRAIREAYREGGVSTHDLAKQYGIVQSAIWDIIHRKNWVHVE